MIPSLQELQDTFNNMLGQDSPPLETIAFASAVPSEKEPPPETPSTPSPCRILDYSAKGAHLEITVTPDHVVPAVLTLDQNGFTLDAVTGVDWIAENQMEVLYDFFHAAGPFRVVLRCRLDRNNPEVPTISGVFPGANWHERETHDFFGIRFLGHPDLTPLLLPEDADYHPLRKDFVA